MTSNNENFQKVKSKLITVLFQDDNESPVKNCTNKEESKAQLIKSIQHGDFSSKGNSFLKEYELGKTLGQGAHAIVKLCWPQNQQQILFAVKITRSSDPEIMEIMKQTFLNTIQLSHLNIIKHYKLYIDQNQETAYMLMDYCPFPSLEKILKEKKKIFESSAVKLFRSLLESVDFIHNKGICHRDIKPDNILVNQRFELFTNIMYSDLSIKLTDFGVSKRFKFASSGKFFWQEQSMWTVTGNLYYRAPEIFSQGGYSQAIDIWSIGVVLYQSLCSSLPYTEEQLQDFIDSMKEEAPFNSPNFKTLSPLCQDLIKRLLKPQPELRLTAKNALLHPWFLRNDENSKTVAKDDLQFSSKDEKKLAFSEQYKQGNNKKSSKQQPTYDVIEERNDDCTPYTNTQHMKNIKNFKENNQLDNIHMVVRDSTTVPQIDFIASYHSTSLGNQQKVNQDNIEQILEQDPFFAEEGQMMVCDSDQSFEEVQKEIEISLVGQENSNYERLDEQDNKELE